MNKNKFRWTRTYLDEKGHIYTNQNKFKVENNKFTVVGNNLDEKEQI